MFWNQFGNFIDLDPDTINPDLKTFIFICEKTVKKENRKKETKKTGKK